MKKTFCDLCQKEIAEDNAIHKIGFGIVDGSQVQEDPTDIEENMDFCAECIAKIMETIRNRSILKDSAAEEAPKPKKVYTVDVGRVWALKDAGWKVRAIAEETGCPEWKIYSILKADRPEMQVAYSPEAAA